MTIAMSVSRCTSSAAAAQLRRAGLSQASTSRSSSSCSSPVSRRGLSPAYRGGAQGGQTRGIASTSDAKQATPVDSNYRSGVYPSSASSSSSSGAPARKRWTRQEIQAIYDTPLMDLIFQSATVHRANHDPSKVQLCTLLNIKTGGCSEDCSYCSQSSKNPTGLKATKLMDIEPVLVEARKAKANGSTRFCMGAAWRDMNGRKTNFKRILEMVKEINGMGMEVCTTLGMLDADQAKQLKDAGLTAYNHNLDTSREFYPKVITTRSYDERLKTIDNVRNAGISVCSGGIIGLGESAKDRVGLIWEMSHLPEPPESFPVNALVPIEGTPLSGNPLTTIQTMLRTICTARIVLPTSIIRLAAGRISYSESEQAMCFLAGANAIFTGERMLTTPTNGWDEDVSLLGRWGLTGMKRSSEHFRQEQTQASLSNGNPEQGLDQKEQGQGHGRSGIPDPEVEETPKEIERNQDKLEEEMREANRVADPVEKKESQPQVWS